MARQKQPASPYYIISPSNLQILIYNSSNTNSIKAQLGLNDEEICPFYVNTSALSLYKELTE